MIWRQLKETMVFGNDQENSNPASEDDAKIPKPKSQAEEP